MLSEFLFRHNNNQFSIRSTHFYSRIFFVSCGYKLSGSKSERKKKFPPTFESVTYRILCHSCYQSSKITNKLNECSCRSSCGFIKYFFLFSLEPEARRLFKCAIKLIPCSGKWLKCFFSVYIYYVKLALAFVWYKKRDQNKNKNKRTWIYVFYSPFSLHLLISIYMYMNTATLVLWNSRDITFWKYMKYESR